MSLNFPDEPNDGDIFEGYVYNATRNVWDIKLPSDNNIEDLNNVSIDTPENGEALIYDGTEWTNQGLPEPVLTFSGLDDTSIATPTAGQKLVFDGTNWVNLNGYVYVNTLYFTSSGTFSKGDYPWLRAIRVKCVGGGGGGTGATATSSSQLCLGAPGGGGGYSEKLYTNIGDLSSSITVTVGAGGAGSNTPGTGNPGASSTFLSQSAGGGQNGSASTSTTLAAVFSNGGIGGGHTGGDFGMSGGSGMGMIPWTLDRFNIGYGGASPIGGLYQGGVIPGGTGGNGNGGYFPGGGGGGAFNSINQATVKTGGNGANGIVMVELYA
jgi:hypothetical protein